MAIILCDHCGKSRELRYRSGRSIPRKEPDDSIYGVLTCYACGHKTIFGMNDDDISFYPGKAAYGVLSDNTPLDVRDKFTDAELCFYGMGCRGAAAMCRACVEAGLVHKGITRGKLEQRIEDAKNNGILTDNEYMLAHGSRLAGNKALHRDASVDPSHVPMVLSATVGIINHLFG